jgi:PGF-CTERM protein
MLVRNVRRNSMKGMTKLMIVAMVVLAAVLIAPAAARGNASAGAYLTVKHIEPGDVLFEYESALDLQNLTASGHRWTPGLKPAIWSTIPIVQELRKYTDDDPSKALVHSIPVGDASNFELIPAAVAGNYGIYYPYNASAVAATAATTSDTVNRNASIQIRKAETTLDVVLATSHVDSVNGKSITRDNTIAFKIGAPYVGVYYKNDSYSKNPGNSRPDSGIQYPAAVKLVFTTPGGGSTTTFGANGQSFARIFVNSSQFYTDDYQVKCPDLGVNGGTTLTDVEAGTYTVTAKWVNAFNLTSGFQDQAPASNAATFTVLSKPITITTNKETVVRGHTFVVTMTGESKKIYWFYIKDASVASGKTYPRVGPGQTGVYNTSTAAQMTITALAALSSEYTSGTGNAQGTTSNPTGGNLTTGADGTRAVEFNTTSTTDDKKYTIKVVDPVDTSKYDTVDVSVEKGTVTITYEGTGTYYLGETIKLSGTNTDNTTTHLFLIGPNLDANGDSVADISVATRDEVAWTFKTVAVNTDDTWSYKWDTSALSKTLDAGTYTIYAAADPRYKAKLSYTVYQSASIVLKKPFITAAASSNTLAKGDKLYIRGTAEGKPANVYVWIFGKNYRSCQNSASVKSDASYEYKLDRGDTSTLYAGQYFMVVQHPMMNGIADIVGVSAGATCVWAQATTGAKYTSNLTPVRLIGLQAPDAATALIEMLNSPDIDDTYTKLSIMIEEPWIRIDTVGDKYVGDTFTITGTTNLAESDEILMTVVSSSFKPTEKTQSGEFSGASGTVVVAKGDTYNTFSFDVDASTFKPDEYLVKAESIQPSQTATTTFNTIEGKPTTVATTVPPTGVTTAATTVVTTEVPVTTAKPQPGFGAVIALIGLGAVAILVLRRH